MAVFAYRAWDHARTRVQGTVIADTPREARDQLRNRGLEIEQIAPTRSEPEGSARHFLLRPGSHGHRVTGFLRELSTLLAVGIPLLEALDTCLKGETHSRFRTVLQHLRDRIASGGSLADALRDHPRCFDALALHLVEVGQNAGTLESALANLATYREQTQQLQGRVMTALMYPLIVLGIGVLVCVFLMTFVVPSLLEALVASGRPLPWITRVVQQASQVLIYGWPWLLGGMLGLAVGFRGFLSHPRSRLLWDRKLLQVPLLGPLLIKQSVSRLAMVMGTLLQNGVPFVQAMKIARGSLRNLWLGKALDRCIEAVGAGRDLGPALEEAKVFPPTVVQIFSIGQQSGQLPRMLERLAIDYDKQVQTFSQRLATLLEPVLILLLAILVGMIAFATILPILEAGHVL